MRAGGEFLKTCKNGFLRILFFLEKIERKQVTIVYLDRGYLSPKKKGEANQINSKIEKIT